MIVYRAVTTRFFVGLVRSCRRSCRFMQTMRNEDYFSAQTNQRSLLSFLKWKKALGIELQGKRKEHDCEQCRARKQQGHINVLRYGLKETRETHMFPGSFNIICYIFYRKKETARKFTGSGMSKM